MTINQTRIDNLVTAIQELQQCLPGNPSEEDLPVDNYTLEEFIAVAMIADDAYENGDEPTFSDNMYDTIRRYIKQTDPENPYNEVVGSDVRGGKVTLPHSMGSLTQVYDNDELQRWKDKHGITPDTMVVISEKEDGQSSSEHFSTKGELLIAFSRGNGTEGADMTRHMRRIKSLPKKVTPNLEIRAEVIISNKNFDFLKTRIFRRDGKLYKNPRNMVAGLMNASEIDPIAYDYIDIIAYHDWNETNESKSEQLQRLQGLGFKVPFYVTTTADNLNEEYLTNVLKKIKESSDYLVDGVVIEIDDAKLRNKMNPSKATLNPEYARKFKVPDAANMAIATVDFVEKRVSKRGYIKPRVHFIPFSLPGITVTHASGYNMKFIIDNGICPGAKVRVSRMGDVVPNIVGIVEKGSYTLEQFYDELDDIGEWKWTKNDKKEEVDVYLIGDHANIGLKLAEAFFTGIGVEGLKLGNLQRLFECGLDTPEKIIKATPDQLGFALGSDSIANKIFESLHKRLKSVTLPDFMGATGLFGRGIGKRKIQQVFDVIGDSILDLHDISQIISIDKWDVKTATKLLNGLPAYKAFFESVKDYVQIVKKEHVEGSLNGQVFVFTGFRNKALQERIQDAGGEVVDSFSGKVTCVIAADPDEHSGKMDKARAKGTRIIGLADIEQLFQ